MGLTQFDEQLAIVGVGIINAATGTARIAAAPFQARQHRVDAVYCTNTDVIAHVVRLWMNKGGVFGLIGSETIPAGAGTGGAPSIDLLATCLPVGEVGLLLDSSCELDVSVEVAVTLSNEVDVVLQGGNV